MNLPNKISIFRISLVPIISLIYLFGEFGYITILDAKFMVKDGIVLLLFLIASISDYFDGKIARDNNCITSFGKFIDPIADKILINTMLILLAYHQQANIIAVLIIIWRDILVDGMRMSASQGGKVVSAQMLGKIKTVLQMLAIIALIGSPIIGMVGEYILYAAVCFSIASGIQYFINVKSLVMESM